MYALYSEYDTGLLYLLALPVARKQECDCNVSNCGPRFMRANINMHVRSHNSCRSDTTIEA